MAERQHYIRVPQTARVDPCGEAPVELLQDRAACLPSASPVLCSGKIRLVPLQRGTFGLNPLACGAPLWNRSPAGSSALALAVSSLWLQPCAELQCDELDSSRANSV